MDINYFDPYFIDVIKTMSSIDSRGFKYKGISNNDMDNIESKLSIKLSTFVRRYLSFLGSVFISIEIDFLSVMCGYKSILNSYEIFQPERMPLLYEGLKFYALSCKSEYEYNAFVLGVDGSEDIYCAYEYKNSGSYNMNSDGRYQVSSEVSSFFNIVQNNLFTIFHMRFRNKEDTYSQLEWLKFYSKENEKNISISMMTLLNERQKIIDSINSGEITTFNEIEMRVALVLKNKFEIRNRRV